MNFASLDYFLFLTFLYLTYRIIAKNSFQRDILLIASSLLFYTLGSGWHIILLLYSSSADYFIAHKISFHSEHKKTAKRWLQLSIFNNLGLLFSYKYLDFFIENLNQCITFFLGNAHFFNLPKTHWILPLGISFYTFQTMSYALDVYYKRLRPCEQFKDFLLYVTFFPQLVAGPILRAQNFIPQISSPFCYRDEHFFKGVFFILVGLIKKTVIADSIGILLVDPIYSNSHHPTFLESLVATYGYAFQIYNDFSGYSDLAIGSALIFGFQVPINFDRPFSCNNPSDFWNRWHISLSHWVRDYLFYPMMMNGRLKNKLKTNLFLTTLIIGIWHGANWTFLIFGLWHGMIAIVHMAIKPITQNLKKHFLWSFFSWIIYFHLIMIGMLIFRAQNLTHLQQLWDSIIGFDMSFKSAINNTSWVCITFTLAIFSHLPRAHQWDKFAQKFVQSKNILKIIVSFACLCAIYLSCQILQGQAAFIYFRF